jgi:hypothetical protein
MCVMMVRFDLRSAALSDHTCLLPGRFAVDTLSFAPVYSPVLWESLLCLLVHQRHTDGVTDVTLPAWPTLPTLTVTLALVVNCNVGTGPGKHFTPTLIRTLLSKWLKR